MHLPEWLTRLLREKQTIESDRDYERDQAAIEAKLAPYRDQRYSEMPPDPRILDTARLAALRDRLLEKYAYRWREVDAVDEIMDALFEPVLQSNSAPFGLRVNKIHLNEKGESPHPRQGYWEHEFKLYYYVTVGGLRPGEFLTSFHEAERLFSNILPHWGYTIQCRPGSTRVRLEKNEVRRDWMTGGAVATLIVAAALDLLASYPEEVKQWRSL